MHITSQFLAFFPPENKTIDVYSCMDTNPFEAIAAGNGFSQNAHSSRKSKQIIILILIFPMCLMVTYIKYNFSKTQDKFIFYEIFP